MPDPPPSRWRAYRDVDAAHDPATLSRELDGIASVATLAAAKQRSLELLELRPGGAVLDVGCGNGPELSDLARIVGSSGRVVGLDRSAALITVAEARGLRECGPIELIVDDAHRLPFEDAEFDACRADRTLQHLERPDAALAEMARVTRPGGRVVATEVRWGLVAPALDESITSSVLQAMATVTERRDWLGILLPVMFEMAGFADVKLVDQGDRLTDFEELVRCTNLHWSVEEAIRKGLSAERASDWTGSLRERVERGEAYAQLAVVHVVGSRPKLAERTVVSAREVTQRRSR